ncbi:MAG: STAS domain-containing protein [Ardenticatenaceae bacterium]|nr:STAS domain-containing protein [Anaerolineales bacterium]MCB9006539.1 STAS domain-containing protein [Ardenticatenaceae bacterium]
MEISVSQANGRVPVTIFHLQGDLVEEEPLRSEAAQAVGNGSQAILLDLTNVPYISSAGLRAIQGVFELLHTSNNTDKSAMNRGIAAGTFNAPNLKLLNPSKNGAKALSVSGYDMFLEVFTDKGKAINSF